MAGIASAAIMGGAALAGTIGSSLLAKSGQAQAGGTNAQAGLEAQARLAAQQRRNATGASPYTALGISSTGLLGSLLGYGTLSSPNPGDMYNFYADPNAQANAIAQLRGFAGASGATLPTATNAKFTPTERSTAISNTFAADPSYAWRVGQGVGALNSAANASGAGRSGAQDQALTKLGQDMGSQEYANWYGRLSNQNNFNLGVDQSNTRGSLATNDQNFGQGQTLFNDQEGQWRNALAMLTGESGQGASSQTAVDNADSGMVSNVNNVGATTANNAANNYASGANALSAGVTGGVNSLASLGSYAMGGGFGGGGGGGGAIPAPGASDAWFNALSKSPGMPGYSGGGATATSY